VDSQVNRRDAGWASFWHFTANMGNKKARRDTMAEWFQEFSVLWAVFPLLDQLVQGRFIDLRMIGISAGISLTTLLAALMIRTGNST